MYKKQGLQTHNITLYLQFLGTSPSAPPPTVTASGTTELLSPTAQTPSSPITPHATHSVDKSLRWRNTRGKSVRDGYHDYDNDVGICWDSKTFGVLVLAT